jgi:hypothetical protein
LTRLALTPFSPAIWDDLPIGPAVRRILPRVKIESRQLINLEMNAQLQITIIPTLRTTASVNGSGVAWWRRRPPADTD